jgi:acetyltransferase-like isoleucine patch superfamily enzyme
MFLKSGDTKVMSLLRIVNLSRGLGYAIRSAVSRSHLLRQLRNLWRFPGLSLDSTVNLVAAGNLEFGPQSVIGEGSNLLVPAGASLAIGAGCYVGRYVELGPGGAISIGDHTSIQDRSILVGDVRLGRYCVLSLNVLMTSGRHYFDRWPYLLIRDQDDRVSHSADLSREHSQPIVVEEDCWLGMNSVVMPGIKIGRGCVIGSNSVVTHDVPPYSVAVGSPARVVRRRLEFDPPDRINWEVPEHIPYFYRGFELAADERLRNAPLEGHLAIGSFSLWLSGKSTSAIRMRVRSSTGNSTLIERLGIGVHVAGEWQVVQFLRGDVSAEMSFGVNGDPVVVSGAWVE